jgi:hypothetical protein
VVKYASGNSGRSQSGSSLVSGLQIQVTEKPSATAIQAHYPNPRARMPQVGLLANGPSMGRVPERLILDTMLDPRSVDGGAAGTAVEVTNRQARGCRVGDLRAEGEAGGPQIPCLFFNLLVSPVVESRSLRI